MKVLEVSVSEGVFWWWESLDIGGEDAGSRAARTEGNSDIGRSSEGGRALKAGSLRFARISAAWRAQRQRAAMGSFISGDPFLGEVGSLMVAAMVAAMGEAMGEVGWRRVIFSW